MPRAGQHPFVKACQGVLHWLCVVVGASLLTLCVFLVLPLMQTISSRENADLLLQGVDSAALPPPPPPPETQQPEEEKPKEQEPPPQLAEEVAPLDLSQLESLLQPGSGEGGGDFVARLTSAAANAASSGGEALFSLADLDQKPRAVFNPLPLADARTRKRAPGSVTVLFVVDALGKVENPVVQKSTDPVFEAPSLAAVRQWKFEPGKRNGQPVRFRMRVPISFEP